MCLTECYLSDEGTPTDLTPPPPTTHTFNNALKTRSTVESATIPTSGQITILDFQSAGEGLPQGFANRHWGVVCTGESPVPVSNSGKSFTVTPPSTMDGKHFGMILQNQIQRLFLLE